MRWQAHSIHNEWACVYFAQHTTTVFLWPWSRKLREVEEGLIDLSAWRFDTRLFLCFPLFRSRLGPDTWRIGCLAASGPVLLACRSCQASSPTWGQGAVPVPALTWLSVLPCLTSPSHHGHCTGLPLGDALHTYTTYTHALHTYAKSLFVKEQMLEHSQLHGYCY